MYRVPEYLSKTRVSVFFRVSCTTHCTTCRIYSNTGRTCEAEIINIVRRRNINSNQAAAMYSNDELKLVFEANFQSYNSELCKNLTEKLRRLQKTVLFSPKSEKFRSVIYDMIKCEIYCVTSSVSFTIEVYMH